MKNEIDKLIKKYEDIELDCLQKIEDNLSEYQVINAKSKFEILQKIINDLNDLKNLK